MTNHPLPDRIELPADLQQKYLALKADFDALDQMVEMFAEACARKTRDYRATKAGLKKEVMVMLGVTAEQLKGHRVEYDDGTVRLVRVTEEDAENGCPCGDPDCTNQGPHKAFIESLQKGFEQALGTKLELVSAGPIPPHLKQLLQKQHPLRAASDDESTTAAE